MINNYILKSKHQQLQYTVQIQYTNHKHTHGSCHISHSHTNFNFLYIMHLSCGASRDPSLQSRDLEVLLHSHTHYRSRYTAGLLQICKIPSYEGLKLGSSTRALINTSSLYHVTYHTQNWICNFTHKYILGVSCVPTACKLCVMLLTFHSRFFPLNRHTALCLQLIATRLLQSRC